MKILKFTLLAAFVCGPDFSECCAVQDESDEREVTFRIPTRFADAGRLPGPESPVPEAPHVPGASTSEEYLAHQCDDFQLLDQHDMADVVRSNIEASLEILPPHLQSEMLLQPVDPSISQFSPVSVHNRQTVRVSERAAEICVKLPKGLKSSVSVNFVEYPPEGDFRIFRTSMMTRQPRLYYLSARGWDSAKKTWIDLHWDPSLSTGGKSTFDYGNEKSGRLEIIVELQHGQRKIVHFVKPEATGNAKVDHVSLDSLDEMLQKHIKPLNEQLIKLQADVENQVPQFEEMKNKLGDIGTLTNDIATRVSKLEQAASPAHRAEKITAQFLFTDAALKIAGHRVTVNGEFKSIDWTSHPSSVVIAVPKSLAALPVSPFNAEVTFFLQERDGEPFATLDPITLQFSESGNHIVAEIPFHQRLAVPLSDSLVRWNKPAATYRLGATINYEIGLDQLDSVRVSGPLGNKIFLTIAP